VATSSTYERRWQRAGQIIHHIIDPRNGMPAQSDVLTASVIATQAIYADCRQNRRAFGAGCWVCLARKYGLPGLVIDQSGNVYTNDAWRPFIPPEGTITNA
jgi:thiamine biosynthesis lipoprotein